MKPALRFQSALGLLSRPCAAAQITACPRLAPQARWTHKAPELPAVPPTLPFVPDAETFLTLIGRGLRQHASKFPTWEALFSLSSEQLRELGVEPPRTRRYLLRWRQRFREGKYGPGADIKHVDGGAAELKVLETRDPVKGLLGKVKREVVNVPAGKEIDEVPPQDLVRVQGYSVKGLRTIVGPYVLPKGKGIARLAVTEGMWEDKRGHKVDGGERRRAEVRFKRGIAHRKAMRESQGFY